MFKKFKKNEKICVYACIVLYSFILMLFCTKSSPLYWFNEWSDPQIYFTLGRGMFTGKVPYRDLFDHKGPLIFFLFGLAGLVSSNSFIGVFVIESISCAIALIYCYKISNLYLDKKNSFFVVIVYSSIFILGEVICQGGSAEEFIMPIMMISLYKFILYFQDNKYKYDSKSMIIFGILTSLIFFIKFNLIVFNCAFLFVMFCEMISKRRFKSFFKNLAYIALGFLIIAVPVFLYFIFNNSTKDFVYNYFIINTRFVSTGNNSSILEQFTGSFKYILENSKYNFILFILCMLNIPVVYISKKYFNRIGKMAYALASLSLMFCVYLMGRSSNYFIIIFIPTLIFSIIPIVKRVFSSEWLNKNKSLFVVLCCAIVALGVWNNSNILQSKIFHQKDNSIQKALSEEINKEKDKSILYYRKLDQGMYIYTQELPNIKFYQKVNISKEQLPEMYESQTNYLRDKSVNFVMIFKVSSNNPLKINENDFVFLDKNYTLTKKHTGEYENKLYDCYLYKRK